MMTSPRSTSLLLIQGIALFLNLALMARAKPMDMEAAKKIPELKLILINVREKGRFTVQDRLVLERNLASGDSVLVSLAACVVAESKDKETNLCAQAEEVLRKVDGMSQAFIQLMLAKKRTAYKKASERIAVIEPLLEDTNPYLQVEAAKELFKNDARRGEDALKALLSADSPIARGEAFRQLHKIGKATNAVPAPMPDERYELLLSIIQGN